MTQGTQKGEAIWFWKQVHMPKKIPFKISTRNIKKEYELFTVKFPFMKLHQRAVLLLPSTDKSEEYTCRKHNVQTA